MLHRHHSWQLQTTSVTNASTIRLNIITAHYVSIQHQRIVFLCPRVACKFQTAIHFPAKHGLIVEYYDTENGTSLEDLDVRKQLVASILQRSEELIETLRSGSEVKIFKSTVEKRYLQMHLLAELFFRVIHIGVYYYTYRRFLLEAGMTHQTAPVLSLNSPSYFLSSHRKKCRLWTDQQFLFCQFSAFNPPINYQLHTAAIVIVPYVGKYIYDLPTLPDLQEKQKSTNQRSSEPCSWSFCRCLWGPSPNTRRRV